MTSEQQKKRDLRQALDQLGQCHLASDRVGPFSWVEQEPELLHDLVPINNLPIRGIVETHRPLRKMLTATLCKHFQLVHRPRKAETAKLRQRKRKFQPFAHFNGYAPP